MNGLVLCSGCMRHVRAGEAACPFCGAIVEAQGAERARSPAAIAATSRAAILFLGAVAASGCGEGNQPGGANTQPTFVPVPPYGAPPPDPTPAPPPPPPPPPPPEDAGPAQSSGGADAGSSKPATSGTAKPSSAPSTIGPPIRIVPPYGVPPIPPEKKKPTK